MKSFLALSPDIFNRHHKRAHMGRDYYEFIIYRESKTTIELGREEIFCGIDADIHR